MPDTPRRTFIRWNPRATGPILTWAAQPAGFTLEGLWLGTTPGRYGPLGQIQIEDDDKTVVKFPMPAVLHERMTMPVGTVVKIEYLGKEIGTRSGKPYHNFDVFSDFATLPPEAEVPF